MGLGINRIQETQKKEKEYTPVKIKDKDSRKSFVINFIDAEIYSNDKKWKIKDGYVYDQNDKKLKTNEIKVSNAEAALIKAAAKGDGNGKYLDDDDLVGAVFGILATKELKENNSKYKLVKDETNNNKMPFGDADAMKNGQIYANIENNKGEKQHFEIRLSDYFISKSVYDMLDGLLF